MPYYAITGRAHGDDEDDVMLIEAGGSNEAAQKFVVEQRRQADITPEAVLAGHEWANVYITTIVVSETPITLVQTSYT